MSWIEQYSTFSGADIVVSSGGVEFGTLQSISWAVSRAKSPIHVMNGSPDPIAYGRGIRAIAGTLSFVNLDREALMGYMENNSAAGKPYLSKNRLSGSKDTESVGSPGSSIITSNKAWATWDSALTPLGGAVNGGSIDNYRENTNATYADELLPFDVHISFTNEYGKAAQKTLHGVEIINEGSGISIEDISLDVQYNFVARKISLMRASTMPGASQ